MDAPVGDRRAIAWLLASQVALVGFLVVCVAASPGTVLRADERGVSNFGVHAGTVVPYTLGMALCAACLWRSGRALPAALRRAGRGFQLTAVMFAVVLVSTYPYKLDAALDDVHLVAAIALFVAQLATVSRLASLFPRRSLVAAAWAVWLAGFLVGAATIVGLITLLFVAQVAMSLAFAVVTITATARLLDAAGDVLVRRPEPRGVVSLRGRGVERRAR